jgi:antitoxin (DNA-binding transcriptional repressor) of toxin-antitoxin stability system
MRTASIREFRNELPSLTRQGEVVLVTNHGKMVGCFLPMEETAALPVELKREFVISMGKTIARELAARDLSEKDVLNDFKRFKKDRRGQ